MGIGVVISNNSGTIKVAMAQSLTYCAFIVAMEAQAII